MDSAFSMVTCPIWQRRVQGARWAMHIAALTGSGPALDRDPAVVASNSKHVLVRMETQTGDARLLLAKQASVRPHRGQDIAIDIPHLD